MSEYKHDHVTDILSPFTGIEFVPKEVLQTAAERGTIVHNHIEGILQGFIPDEEDETIKNYLKSFQTFWDYYKSPFEDIKITIEKRLFCDIWEITGKPDVIIEGSNRTYIIDWKTSKQPHKSWALQGAAYRYLLEVNGYYNVEPTIFVKLNKEGREPGTYQYKEYEEDLVIFHHCIELFRFFDMKKTRKPWEKR